MLTSIMNIPKALLQNKLKMHIEWERSRTRALIHSKTVEKWIDSSLMLDEDRYDVLRNEISRFDYLYPSHTDLLEGLISKFKVCSRAAYQRAVIKLIAEKAYKCDKLNFKLESGMFDSSFDNIYIRHDRVSNNLVFEHINNKGEINILEYQFPYVKTNKKVPDIKSVEGIVKKALEHFNVKIQEKTEQLELV